MKRSRINPTNRQRQAKNKARVWGPPGYKEHVVAQGCSVRGCTRTPIEAHHQPTRGAGGAWRDQTSWCRFHHTSGSCSVHTLGIHSFTEMFDVDWDALKRTTLESWEAENGGQERA